MSKPTNGAARNVMSEFERQCYDWGWQDSEDRIIELLFGREATKIMYNINSVNVYGDVAERLIALIKGESK